MTVVIGCRFALQKLTLTIAPYHAQVLADGLWLVSGGWSILQPPLEDRQDTRMLLAKEGNT